MNIFTKNKIKLNKSEQTEKLKSEILKAFALEQKRVAAASFNLL